MRLSIDATGVTHLRQTVENLGATARKGASQAVRKAAFDIEAHAKRHVPVDTGHLKSSIGVTLANDGLIAVIGPSAHYGEYVEFGTAKRKPRPYMHPALEAIRPGFEAAVRQIIPEAMG